MRKLFVSMQLQRTDLSATFFFVFFAAFVLAVLG